MNDTKRQRSALALLFLFLPATTCAQQPIQVEFYQDFRNNKPMLPEFHLFGPDRDDVATFEPAGLRITLPKTRNNNQPLSVGAKFVINGDFEITGTYELLNADAPTDGYGVGISLNIGTTKDRNTFLKMARLMRPKTGSVHMAEYWTKGANDWKGPQVPTEIRSGQLRLVREGAKASCQVSEGAGKEFTTVFEKADFPKEDIHHMVFQVTDGNKPGYNVDARLIDLRVRYGRLDAVADLPVLPKPAAPQTEGREEGSIWLPVTLALCFGLTLTIVGGVGVFVFIRGRRGRRADVNELPPAESGENVKFDCSACGKHLKTKASSAGKKLKCPKCGTIVVVPRRDEVHP
jgi:DNA-directed RNA polymerase subunit RPC12/RpoP